MKHARAWRRHCPHSDLRPIYGDEINHVGGWRLQCRTCGRFLNGPVSLAKSRASEAAAGGDDQTSLLTHE